MSDAQQRAALDLLASTATASGLPWSDDWRAPLTQLLTWLARFSARTNLVGNHAPAVVAREHLLETLAVAAAVKRAEMQPASIVDVGAGAGLELLMLGLWAPSAQLVAVEPRRKRADFIELVGDAMGLGRRLEVVRSQVPPWLPATPFDLATSRATFSPAQWLVHAATLVGPAGLVAVHDATKSDEPVAPTPTKHLVLAAEVPVPDRPSHRIGVYRHVGTALESEGS